MQVILQLSGVQSDPLPLPLRAPLPDGDLVEFPCTALPPATSAPAFGGFADRVIKNVDRQRAAQQEPPTPGVASAPTQPPGRRRLVLEKPAVIGRVFEGEDALLVVG